MRVVLLTPEYPPALSMGGIGTNTATLARELTRLGHAVTVIVPGHASATTDEDGVMVVRVRHRWLPVARAERLLSAARLAQTVRAARPDVVHAAEWGALAWGVARFTRLPLVTRLATPTHIVEELNSGTHLPHTALLRWMEQQQTTRSAAVYAPTKAIAARVGRDWGLPVADIVVIPNSIDTAAVRTAGEAAPTIALPDRFLVFIGRLERRKGFDELGTAVAAALAAHPDLHAVVIGRDPGDEGGELVARFCAATEAVRERVHLLGELGRDEALAVVARAELVLLPSLWESFGYVCVEALALGRPVVAGDAGGFAEIIDHGSDGWLVAPGDAQALTRETLARLADSDTTWRVAAAGRTTAQRYDVRTVIATVEKLLVTTATESSALSTSIYRGGYRDYFHPEERHDPFRRLYERKRRLVESHFGRQPPGKVLDAGGGFGRLSGPLSARHSVIMCDISESMLAEASRRLPPEVALVQADVRALPFDGNTFDSVLALDVLCHLPDSADALRELMRVVRSGGTLVFDTTNARPGWALAYPGYVSWRPRRLLRTLQGRGVLPEWRELVRHHTPAEVRRAAAAAGLRLESLGGIGPAGLVKWHVWRATRLAE